MKTINLKVTEGEYEALVREQESRQLKTGRKQPLAELVWGLCTHGMEAAAVPQGNAPDGAISAAVLDQARFLAEWERRLNQKQREVWKELEEHVEQNRSGSAKRCAELEKENRKLAEKCKTLEERLAGHLLELQLENVKGEVKGREAAVTELLKAQAEELDQLRRSVREDSRRSSEHVAELQKNAVMALTVEKYAHRNDGDGMKQLLTLLAGGVAGAALATVAGNMLKDDKPEGKLPEGK